MTLCQHTQGGCWHPVCSPPTWALEPPTMALGSSRGARDQRGMSPARSTQRQKPGSFPRGQVGKITVHPPKQQNFRFLQKSPRSPCL